MAEEAKKDKKEDAKKGKDAKAAPETKDAAPDDGGSKKKKMIIIGAIAGVVIVGGGVGGFMMFSGGEKSETPPATAAEGQAAAPGEHGAAPAATGAEAGTAPAAAKATGEAAPSASTAAKPADATEENPSGFGDTYNFKTFHLNLGNPLENHYIRLEIAAEYKGGDKQKAEIERRMPQLRDAVVSVVSSKSREFLLGPDGKAQLRREILIKVNRYMTTPIESVFITDLLIE